MEDGSTSHAAPARDVVAALAHARRTGTQIHGKAPEWDLADDAAGVQAMFAVADQLAWPRLGWKIAATHPDLQARLRTDGPVFGITYTRFLRMAPAVVSHRQLLDPVIECEFAFRIGRELATKEGDHDFQDLAAVVASVMPCIEIAECRFARGALPPPRYIMADGFASGWYVLGEPIADWQQKMANGIGVQLLRNGQPHSHGTSTDVMGHPLLSVVWLANALRRLGRRLEAGALVSSGSCNILCRAAQGDRFEARYDGCASVVLETP